MGKKKSAAVVSDVTTVKTPIARPKQPEKAPLLSTAIRGMFGGLTVKESKKRRDEIDEAKMDHMREIQATAPVAVTLEVPADKDNDLPAVTRVKRMKVRRSGQDVVKGEVK